VYGCSENETLELIRNEAAQRGLDGVRIRCSQLGVVGWDMCACDGEGFLCVGPADAAAVPAARCTPGATQACVGAGSCKGGQACLADGSAWDKCDCGG